MPNPVLSYYNVRKIMPIICQICMESFPKLISSSHLKKHKISSQAYKLQFGNDSLASKEYRESRSKELSGSRNPMFGKKHSQETKNKVSHSNTNKIPHNKGKTINNKVTLNKIRESIKQREEKYKQCGNHPRKAATLSVETKEKIRSSVKKYSDQNMDEIKDRAQKSIKTKIENNYDFGKVFRNKQHTENTKTLISQKSKNQWQKRFIDAVHNIKEKLDSINICINSITPKIASLRCLTCNSTFNFTRQYFTNSKFRNDLCPVCRSAPTKSKEELNLLNFIKENYTENVSSGNRILIYPQEIGIYIEHKNIAFEYCGLYWHSELQGKDPLYHYGKHEKCSMLGIRLITIFEDEWIHKQDIVKSRILSLLQLNTIKISARKCIVKKIDNNVARHFCHENHIQGQGTANISYGLYDSNENLISSMTFSKPSISKGARHVSENSWELNRFCSKKFITVNGAAGKLFKYFVNDVNPDKVFSYSDIRWNTGNVYNMLGFTKVSNTPPNYWYIDYPNLRRIHRFGLRKNKDDNPTLSEWDNRKNQGWDRIWDCGNTKWEWVKPTPII